MDRERLALVVEDDADIAMVCTLHLEDAGFDVLLATTGQEALERATEAEPSVVVLDYMLPDIDGLQVLRLLRETPATADIPVVMVTARTHERDQLAAWQAGVSDFVTKPFQGSRLVGAVTAALDRSDAGAVQRRTEAMDRLVGSAQLHATAPTAVLDGAQDAVIVTSLDGEITYWNEGAERMFGWLADEAIGSKHDLIMLPDDGSVGSAMLDALASGQRLRPFDLVCVRRNGQRITVSIALSPVRAGDGSVVAASAVVRDITERTSQEARYRGLFEGAPEAMVVVDADGMVEMVNRQAEQLFGYARSELLGRPADTLAPDWFRRDQAGLGVMARRRDGSRFPVEVSQSTVESEDGTPLSAVVVRDSTERTREEARFLGLVEAAPDAVVIVGDDGRILLVNQHALRMFGYSRAELVGKQVELLVPEHLRERHVEHRRSYLRSPWVRPLSTGQQLSAVRKDGTEFPVEISLSPIETDGGLTISASIRDVSERRRAEAAQVVAFEREREATARLREVDRLRSDFLSTVSHELRTPLTAIKGFAEWLVSSWEHTSDERKRNMVVRMLHAGGRLDFLIQDLLDFSRLERGHLKIELEPQPLSPIVSETIRHATPALERHHLELLLDDSAVVLADRSALMRVIENVLTNAAKFSAPGSTITVQSQAEPHEVTLSVRDEGVGIRQQDQEKVFGRFYRAPNTATQHPGTGIGLAIVKQFVEAQDGRVTLVSTPGTGSEFTLHLRPGSG